MTAFTTSEADVYVVHGEGSRERAIEMATNAIKVQIQMGFRAVTHDVFNEAANTQPSVMVMLRDLDQCVRIEMPLGTWEEVEAFKTIPGVWSDQTQGWRHPLKAKVRITLEAAE